MMEIATKGEFGIKDRLLLNHIHKCPGIRYKELQRVTGFSNGVLTYHLAFLEESQIVKSMKQVRVARYFPASISEQESYILRYIRHKPVRLIMKLLLESDFCTFQEIIDNTGKAPSTISERLKTLKLSGIIAVRYGERQLYYLSNKELVGELFFKYRESLTDKIVDNYIDIIDEM